MAMARQSETALLDIVCTQPPKLSTQLPIAGGPFGTTLQGRLRALVYMHNWTPMLLPTVS